MKIYKGKDERLERGARTPKKDPIGFPEKLKAGAGEVNIIHNKENVSKLNNIFNLQIKWGQ